MCPNESKKLMGPHLGKQNVPSVHRALACVRNANNESSSLYFKVIPSAYGDWITKEHIVQLLGIYPSVSE